MIVITNTAQNVLNGIISRGNYNFVGTKAKGI